MADVKINIDVNDHGSTAKVTSNAKALKVQLEEASASAKRTALALEYARKGMVYTNTLNNARKGVDNSGDSSKSRSIGGGTGSDTRDFAKQAQGLGGLVHVYATFAANIFAITTAFSALSKAMDTANLVKGLDQIGASSGRNLGSVAKQMVAAADGAISLKDALSSTAIAASGGLTNATIIRMTEVAKKASLALGRDLPDSMNRLTKGIIKIEPELLDEIGIMTRVIPAQQEYARQIGKTVASLTDFEKRQAFANAAISEGERKFGSINLDANPYSKISSAIQNLTQNGLELVNKVLGPIVSILSTSPTALTAVLVGMSTVLLKQAIPALGMYRDAAKAQVEEAFKNTQRLAKDNESRLALADADAALRAEKIFQTEAATIARVDKLKKASLNAALVGKDVRATVKKNVFEQSAQEVDAIKSRREALLASDDETYRKQGEKLTKYLAHREALLNDRTVAGDEAEQANLDATGKRWSHNALLAKNYSKAVQDASKASILASTSEAAAILGPRVAWQYLNEEIAKSKAGMQFLSDGTPVKATGALTNGVTRLSGAFSIVTSYATTALSTIANFAMYVGIAIAIFQTLDSVFSGNAKQSAAFSDSLSALNSSFDNISKTIDVINKKSLADFLSVESTQAKSNALNDLTDNLNTTVTKFFKLQEVQTGWDRFFDGFFDLFGKGSGDKLAAGISNSVINAFQAMEEGPAKVQAQKSIEALLGQKVDTSNFKAFNAVIKDLDKTDIGNKGSQISAILANTAREAGNAAASLSSFKTALSDIDKQSTTMSNTLIPTDEYSKLGTALANSANALDTALKNPIHSLQAMRELAGDTRALSLLPPDTAIKLGSAKKELDALSESLSKLQKQEEEASKRVDFVQSIVDKSPSKALSQNGNIIPGSAVQQKDLALAKEQLEVIKKQKIANSEKLTEVQTTAKQVAKDLADASYMNLAKGLNKALAEASVTAAKGYLDVLKQAGGTTGAMDVELNKRAVAIQINAVNATYENSKRMVELGLAIERNSIVVEQGTISKSISERGGIPTVEMAQRLDNLAKELDLNTRATATLKSGDRAVLAAKKEANPENAAMLAKLGNLPIELFGKMQALAGLFAQQSNLSLQQKAAEVTDPAQRNKAAREVTSKALGATSAELESIDKASSIYNDLLQTQKEIVSTKILDLKYAQAQEDISTKIALAKIVINSGTKDAKVLEEARLVLARESQDRAVTAIALSKEKNTLDSTNLQSRIAGEASLIAANKVFEDKRLASQNELNKVSLETRETTLSYLRDIGALTDSEYTTAQARVALELQAIEYKSSLRDTTEAQALAEKDITDKIAIQTALLANSSSAENGAVILSQIAALNVNLDKTTQSYIDQKTALDAGNVSRAEAIRLTAEHKALQESQAAQMTQMVNVTTNLTTVFGELGSAIGATAEAILSMAHNDTTYLTEKLSLQNKLDKENDPTKKLALTKALGVLGDKQAKNEVDSISSIAKASKKMFSEKTAGYKLLNAVEKAASAYKIALQVKELALDFKAFATKIGLISTEVATSTAAEGAIVATKLAAAPAKVAADVPGILSSFSTMGPLGYAVGAALVATLLSMVGGGGKGAGAIDMTGMTSKDRQETQGTGQSWQTDRNGNIVKTDTGGGVFGDSEAKSTAIVDSLEIMKANSIEGLDYDNKMLKALEILASSVGEAAKSLYSINGLRSGTNFGTMEGSSSSGGFGSDIPVIGGILGSIFGGGTSSSSEITSAGIQLKGSFKEVMEDTTGSILQYKDVLTKFHEDGGWFGSDSDWSELKTETQAVSSQVSQSIADVFKNADSIFTLLGDKIGIAQSTISSILSSVDVSTPIDLMGLTGQELIDELNAVIGSQLSTAAAQIFSEFGKYKQFGEDYLTTVIRVVDANDKVNMALKSIGASFLNIGKFDVSDLMVKNAGSLATFMDQAAFFKDNFLSAAEQLAPVQASVNNELERLGISTSITKDEFKQLVLAQNTSTAAGQSMYQSLMELAPGYMSTIKLQEEIATGTSKTYDLTIALLNAEGKTAEALAMTRAKELKALSDSDAAIQSRIYFLQDETALLNARKSLEIAIYTALGNSEAALALTRQDELKALDARLIPAKKYLYALQDEATIKGKLITAYNKETAAIKSTVTALTTSIKTLADYRTSLLTSDKSTSTPAEKYQETKRQAAQVAAIASGIATTDAEILAKQDAISKLPSVTDTFLQASRELYASSTQYTQDFNSVLTLLDSTGASLILQQTDAQRQLDALTTNTTILSLIEDNTASVADLLSQYLTATSATELARQSSAASGSVASGGTLPAFAEGGLASGIALVGEKGPEIVNFTNPGRVYSNKASNDMFNNAELIAEIKALHKEVAQLRQDQKAQTGHLIASNYDANARAATQVVNATEDAVTQSEWLARSAVKIA